VFATTSRYAALATATVSLPEGRTATYVRRRFLPQTRSLLQLASVTVVQNDRIDLITARTLGDPEQFWRICDANEALDPTDLVVPGRTLRVPLPQS
jgi:nucleoid-associated protein YgaU